MAITYKSGIKVKEKDSTPTKVHVASVFANQMNRALESYADSLQQLNAKAEVPKKLYLPIQAFFGAIIPVSDQYKPTLKQLTTNHLKKTQALKLYAENFESLANRALSRSKTADSKLLLVLHQLISDVHHFIQQQEMTHYSYTPGMSPNVRPVNWGLREAVNVHIIEHQKKFGTDQYPNLNAAQLRARSSGHTLSDRTYRELKTMHGNGTLFNYAQTRKRQ
jgi:hypothetical protein